MRVIDLEKRHLNLKAKESLELEQKLAIMISWAKEVSVKTGVTLPKI